MKWIEKDIDQQNKRIGFELESLDFNLNYMFFANLLLNLEIEISWLKGLPNSRNW